MSYIIEKVKIETVNLNPANPRKILDEQFEKLKASIQRFPKMLELRPLVLNDKNQVIGGNMRLLAMIKLGFTDVFIVRAADLTEEEIRQFVVLDNVSFGFWDFEMLGARYDHEELVSWGMPDFDIGTDISEDKSKKGSGASSGGGANDEVDKNIIRIECENIDEFSALTKDIEHLLKSYPSAKLKVEEGE